MVTLPSSRGWRRTSRTCFLNSGWEVPLLPTQHSNNSQKTAIITKKLQYCLPATPLVRRLIAVKYTPSGTYKQKKLPAVVAEVDQISRSSFTMAVQKGRPLFLGVSSGSVDAACYFSIAIISNITSSVPSSLRGLFCNGDLASIFRPARSLHSGSHQQSF